MIETRTGHAVKLAFPPGPRRKGAGRLVSIAHPHAESRTANPQCNTSIEARKRGFVDGLIEKCKTQLADVWAGIGQMGKTGNPKGRAPKRNLDQIRQAQELYEKFQGRPSIRVTAMNEPFYDEGPDDLAMLGGLYQLVFVPENVTVQDEHRMAQAIRDELDAAAEYDREQREAGKPSNWCLSNEFWRKTAQKLELPLVWLTYGPADNVAVTSDAEGEQLYLVGGRQQLSKDGMESFGIDAGKAMDRMGKLAVITYLTAEKGQPNRSVKEKGEYYYHCFAEERAGSEWPRADYVGPQGKIYLVGGDYEVEGRGIVN